MRVALDRTKCAGIGVCEGLEPERFQVQLDVAQEAVDMCPTASLRIVE